MTPAEATYRRARAACEALLDANRNRAIDIDEFLRAAPGVSWRALDDALARLVAEKRLTVVGRLPGRKERIGSVIDRLVLEASQEAHRQAERVRFEFFQAEQREREAARRADR